MKICPRCKHENLDEASFCSKCGLKLEQQTLKADSYKRDVFNVSIMFFVLLIFILIVGISDFSGYKEHLYADAIFAIIVFVFFFTDINVNSKTIFPKRFNIKLSLKIIGIAIGYSVLVYFIAGFLSKVLNLQTGNYYTEFFDAPSPFWFGILILGVSPAIVEEFAFRNILFSRLLKITSSKATIIVTAILFTILHLTFISALWIFPIGLFLGWLRSKHNSIVYGVIFHFFYNSTLVVIDMIFYYAT